MCNVHAMLDTLGCLICDRFFFPLAEDDDDGVQPCLYYIYNKSIKSRCVPPRIAEALLGVVVML